MTRKQTTFSTNPSTNRRFAAWERKQSIFNEVKAAGALTDTVIASQEEELRSLMPAGS